MPVDLFAQSGLQSDDNISAPLGLNNPSAPKDLFQDMGMDTPVQSPYMSAGLKTEPNIPSQPINSINQLQQTATDLSLNEKRKQAQSAMEEQARVANEAKTGISGALQRAGEGYLRGAEQGGIGALQAFNKLTGKGNNAEDLQEVARNLEMQGKGAGISGSLGEVVGNPVNVAQMAAFPEGMAARAVLGAATGALQPTTGQGNTTGQNIGINTVTNAILPPVLSGAAKGVGAVTNAILPTSVLSGTSSALQGIANKTGAAALATKIADSLGINPNVSKVYQAAKETNFDPSGKSPKEIADNLQAWLSANQESISGIVSGKKFDPVDANVAISKQYGKALDQAGELYDTARKLGANDVIPAEGVVDNIDGLIKNLAEKPIKTSKENGALSKLMGLREEIGNNTKVASGYSSITDPYLGTKVPDAIPVNTLIDLKQIANQYFDKSEPDPFFSKLANLAKTGLKQAGETNPKFGEALNEADQYWGKEVAPVYTNNKLLDKFWNTDDFYDVNALVKRGQPLPLELRKRSSEWIDKIKSPEELESLTKALPEDQADSLSGQVAKNLIEKSGYDAKSIVDPKKYAVMQQALKNKPEAQESLENMRIVLADLNLRGLDNSMPENIAREVMQGNNSAKEALKAMWSATVGKKMYAVSHAAKAAAGVEGATGEALKGFQKGIKTGAPFKQTIPNATKKLAPFIGRAGATGFEHQIEQ